MLHYVKLSDLFDVQHYVDIQETEKHPFNTINSSVEINNQSNPPVIDGSSLSTSINSEGELTLSFDEIGENRNGEAELNILVVDPNNLGLSDSISFTIKVTPINDHQRLWTLMNLIQLMSIKVLRYNKFITANDIEGDEITDPIQISVPDGNTWIHNNY